MCLVVRELTPLKGFREETKRRALTCPPQAGSKQEFLDALRHTPRSLSHPQTNGKGERFHQTPEGRVHRRVYTRPKSLPAALWLSLSSSKSPPRSHEGIGNVTPQPIADEAARKRFPNDALALSKLDHSNIATRDDFNSNTGVDSPARKLLQSREASGRLLKEGQQLFVSRFEGFRKQASLTDH